MEESDDLLDSGYSWPVRHLHIERIPSDSLPGSADIYGTEWIHHHGHVSTLGSTECEASSPSPYPSQVGVGRGCLAS